MRSIVRGVVALFAAILMMDVAKAAPTIVSPADYSAFSTYSIAFKEILEEGSLGPDAYVSSTWSNPYFSYTDYSSGATAATSKRVADRLLMRDNALPVTLKWAGSAGQVVVKLWRTKKDSANNPQFTVTTTGTSAKFYDLEFGRNYTWTVTDSTGTATGHFYITNDSGAPRILLYDQDPDASGADTSNTRDMGGWRTTNGKVVKQGLIYRTGELEWCNPTGANGMRQELTYLKNTLGIKFDMDFRNYTDLQNKLAYVGENSITKHGWKWAWKNGSYLNLNESNIGEGVVRLNINKLTGVQFGSYTGLVPKESATGTESKNNRKNVWCAFTNLANSANWPMVFHCSHGKDRAGTFALVIQGVLGVPKEAALKDYAISWFDSPDEKLGPSSISNTCVNLATYVSGSTLSTTYFKDQCVNFLVQCGKDAGLSETTAKNKITAFQNAMLEEPEMPDLKSNLTSEPETDGDTFSYVNLYHRRQAGGGSLASDNGSTLSYMYTTETGESTHPAISKFNNYNACLYFYPTAGLPYSSPVCGYAKVGKVVSNGRYSPAAVGPYNFKAYFSSDGHTKTSRTIIEHRAGLAEYENVDLYFTEYNSSNLGEGGRNLAYVYTGDSAAIEIWANATMRIMDMRDMSQKRTTKGYKAYIKFPKGRCANARLEAMEIDGDGENLLGWFTGGEAGTRQYMKVSNAILQFNAPSKTSTVEGSLGLEFSLGDVITTSSAAMLKVASKLVIPAGSTLTVNAGRKGAGTYKLIQAGTLTDNANLTLRANYKVDNCKIGYYGTIVNEGNNINLVIQEGTAPDDESFIDTETEGDWGYRLKIGNEVVLAFTNHTKSVNWKVPANIANARFLVVGGGGGGGGGVVTGNISLNADDFVSIFVGAGGAGGTVETDKSTSITTESCFGASAKGKESKITVNNIDYVKAFGGGQDQGVSSSSASGSTTVSGTPHVGGLGGSNAGSRGGYASEQAAIDLDNVGYVANFEALSNCQRYGNIGGMGSQEIYYGHPAAGGGGGATEPGGNAGNKAAGWPAGKGGEGLSSDITGTMLVYGSGGGGASGQGSLGGVGGTGAGDGGDRADSQGTSAVANQGGGGGGSSRETTRGGNGGSGIVVIRYVEEAGSPDDPDAPVVQIASEPAVIPNLVYNGNEQNGVIAGEGYVLSGVTKATFAGTYEAVATLKSGYTWSDGATEAKTLTWSIAQFSNSWTVEPSISLDSWISGSAAGELIVGVARFGGAPTGVFVKGGEGEFTTMPTAPGEYEVKFTIPETSDWTGLTKTVAFTILEPGEINPTEYGAADTAASTYMWRGYDGPWAYTTNWTATASGTYGIPNGTYATADFPASLENAFTCTLSESRTIDKVQFGSPNMTFVLDNALLTLNGKVGSYRACDFGGEQNDNSTIVLKGAAAGIVSAAQQIRINIGCRHDNVTPTGVVTARFVVPETGWENEPRIRATGYDSKVVFYSNTKIEIDATALGVPAEGTSKSVLLASGTGDDGVYVESTDTNIVCAAGATGSIAVVNKQLVLTVVADPNVQPEEPEEPVLVAVDAPVAATGLVYTGDELTGVVAAKDGYVLSGDLKAINAGTYTATATLAEGYKWSDDTTEPKTITWSIAKATNAWTTEPSISLDSWTEGETAGVLTAGVAKFGEVVVTIDGAAFEMPTAPGAYTVKYAVVGTDNYNGFEMSVSFEILEAVVVPDPDEPGDEPQEPESNIPVIDSKWGYVKTGLGALGNEVAVVFTNHTEEATWTVPEDIENVQFLVVGGGGGGGGAVNSSKGGAGGAGGGGGCVVTGVVNQLAKDAVVAVQVGNGGAGGTYYSSETQGKGNASHGGNTYFKVGDVTYVTAYGGAGDLGYNKNSGVNNGSNSGSRLYNSATASSAVGTAATWNQSELADKLSNVNTFRNKGGYNPGKKGSASGGGGGAIAAGANVASSAYGGSGGAGLMTDITGDGVMFGSGGGGGTSRGANTTGYDSRGGGDDDDAGFCGGAGGGKVNGNGEDALVNQGGGGGGAGWGGNGGNGGSGIVVFRYTLKTEVKVDAAEYIESKIFDKHYTGLLQTSGLTEDEAYTVSEVGGTDVGVYEVVVTLKDGFAWADGDSNKSRTFTWNILKEPNNWKTPLALSATSWAQHYAANVKFVQPVQTVGELNATITKDGVTEAFGGTLPVDPGVYTLKYWVEEDTLNYNGCSAEVTFTVYRSEAIDGGYKVFGLGENGNEEAMVFTQSGNWTLDATLSNVRFLVVGGGGGGGADCSASAEQYQGGSGGGGGGVVTGVANLVKGQTLAITVGQGGQGGVRGGSSPYGAVASQATDSSFAINGATTVTAYAGGGDTGSTVNGDSASSSGGQTGGAGGSSAGSRATASGRGEATRGAVVESDAIVSYEMFGEQGGAGAAQYQAGGGGGATEEGSAGTFDNGGNGGEGLASDIAGTMLVYGSGGGGGAVAGGAQGPGLGGTGAGNGGQYNEATSAVANQGGGGGGGGRVGNGGNGGSGIVVFRYVVLKSPTIGDSPVDAAEVFEIAKVSKPVLYPSEPEVSTNTVDGVKVVTVAFCGVNAQVPDCYDVIKSVTDKGYQISLVIKDEFKNPSIANSADDKTPAIKIEDGKVKIHLEGTHGRLHYSLMTSTSLESSESWTTAKGDWSDNANFEFGDGDQKLDDARFFKVGEVSDEPMDKHE